MKQTTNNRKTRSFHPLDAYVEQDDLYHPWLPLPSSEHWEAPAGVAARVGAFWMAIILTLIALNLAGAGREAAGTARSSGTRGADLRPMAGAEAVRSGEAWDLCANPETCIRRGCVPAAYAGGYPDVLRDAIAGLCVGVPLGELMGAGGSPEAAGPARRAAPKGYEKHADPWFGLERL